jgi:transposase
VEPAKYSTYDVRIRAVNAILTGQRKTDVARAYQVDYTTLYRWCKRYGKHENLYDLQRQHGSGRPNILDIKSRERLTNIVMKPASHFGYETDFWTCRRLIQVTEQELKVNISQPTMWRTLRDIGLTYQKPQRQYFEANDRERKKWIRYEVPKIKRFVLRYRAILYFQDESNISLTAVLGKTWAPKGQTPIQRVTGKRGGISAMSAISKSGQLVFRLHQKRITSVEIIDFLAQLLKHHKYRHLVVVMDQAPPHTSNKTQSFINAQKRLHVFYLPAYSPDFNADEQVWNHLKHQELKSHQARTKEELNVLANKKLNEMSTNPDLLNGIFFRCYIANFLN